MIGKTGDSSDDFDVIKDTWVETQVSIISYPMFAYVP